ncbi:solute carrier family 25 member 35-like isoform X2 [Vespa crabro]|uniref:solute carrier family 25 member 35-like isoform X2 n=1 Tax=Vespa crabro TaxID=7445 RepID=UPI001EFF6DB6|nr:solute carrier family 25 member 35-like isoform X2 [Vespa crabro]
MATAENLTVPSIETEKPLGAEFVIGAISAAGAGLFTNPADVIKIRLQLQGELEARGAYKKIYKNTFHAAYLIAKHEGILALQSGIAPALYFQVVLNGIRLGVYNTATKYGFILDSKGNTDILKTVLITGLSGCLGGVLGSPFYLVKTQIQAQSAQSIAVGYQHGHTGTLSAFIKLWKQGGITALYRGWYANIPRLFIGSSTQLTTFSLVSDLLRSWNILTDYPITLTFVSSLIGGSCVAVTMQPFDVLATRLYNQRATKSGKGELYNGLYDALVKIIRTEGLYGLYKGTFPTWMRIAPHTVLCLVFYKKLDQLYDGMRT